MVYGSIVSIIDRLSVKTVLSGATGSVIGFVASLAFIAVCLAVLIPPVDHYFKGAYFQSQFQSSLEPKTQYIIGQDIILAMSFRNKITGEYANHSEILQQLVSIGAYDGQQYYRTILQGCDQSLFKNSINPIQVKDCIMLPKNLIYDSKPVDGSVPGLQFSFLVRCDDPFACNDNNPNKNITYKFISDLSKNFFFQFIFNSMVIDEKGNLRNQFHKVYSSQYQSPDGFNTILFIRMAQKKYIMDDSILPWWNNRVYPALTWGGSKIGRDQFEEQTTDAGFHAGYFIYINNSFSYRYYKKLDFILGMIGGAVFLIFLFFWLPFSYINRTLQKMKNAQQLFLSKDQIITTEQNLHRISIPFYHVFTRYLPGNPDNKIIQQAQMEIDIVKLIKKVKVTHRNLRTNGLDLSFKSKDLDFQQLEPQQFNPDRPVIHKLDITWDSYQALTNSRNTVQVYENNPVVLSLLPNNHQRLDRAMQDQIYEKNRIHQNKFISLKARIFHYIGQIIRYFDIFGARPMFNAEPQTSSCWGFFLTLVIIVLSVLTFALTIQNMDSKKIITSYKYQHPQNHYFQIISGKNYCFAICFDSAAANTYLTGPTKSVQLTFYKNGKKHGYQQMAYQKMAEGQFQSYFKLSPDDPYISLSSQNCFKPEDGQTVPMGGSYSTINEAYFGVKLDPFCSGTPYECENRKNQTISNFVNFVKLRSFGIYLSENKYSPTNGKIISGITGQGVSESEGTLDANLFRTQTIFLSSIQLLDDTSASFSRTEPKLLQKTIVYTSYGARNEQRKGDQNVDPGYNLQFRVNGQVKSIILRTYKIDFLLGIIGGVFLFWYFFIHFFAKIYNSYKVRAKLAQILHQQDGYDESMIVHFLYLTKIPTFLFCCSQLQQDIERVKRVDEKIERDLDYLELTKKIDTCYKISSSLFSNIVEKDVSLIYFREKIDEAELVKPKRIKQVQADEFQDDEFLEFDEQVNVQHQQLNATGNLLPQISAALDDHQLQKIINANRSAETCPLQDPFVPNKKQKLWLKLVKKLDFFKNPAELTLDGQRDVKSILGGLACFLVTGLIIAVVAHFITIYINGNDYTVSQTQFIDADLDNVDPDSQLGDLVPGINVVTGRDFKFMMYFHKKDHYFPYDVSQYIGTIGVRMMQYTLTNNQGVIQQRFQEYEMEPCQPNYLNGFLSPYDDPAIYSNISLAYCLPDGVALSLTGTPLDPLRKYFKHSIYNKAGNETGRAYLNSFFKIYLVNYFMSVPRLDIFASNFNYQMVQFNFFNDPYSHAIQTNLTFSKLVFTDKYYSKSRQTYNDQTQRLNERIDVNYLSNESTRNVSFYYNGMINHYTLDYPGGAQLFGIVGGVIAFFVFIIYSFVSSYNEYRMKYLIGQRLYTFDKRLSGLAKQKVSKEKNKKVNLKKLEQATKAVNNFSQPQILLAWMLNPIGYLRDNYNFNKTLRRVTLLIERVENDINLFNVYKQLFTFKNTLDKKVRLSLAEQMQNPVTVTSIFIKHIYQKDPISNHIPLISRQSKKHKFSSYEEFKINKAIQDRVDPVKVFGDKSLNRAFGLDDGTSILGSKLRMYQEKANNQSLIHTSFIHQPPSTSYRNEARNPQDRLGEASHENLASQINRQSQIFAESEQQAHSSSINSSANKMRQTQIERIQRIKQKRQPTKQMRQVEAFSIEDASEDL